MFVCLDKIIDDRRKKEEPGNQKNQQDMNMMTECIKQHERTRLKTKQTQLYPEAIGLLS